MEIHPRKPMHNVFPCVPLFLHMESVLRADSPWESAGAAVPTWKEAYERLVTEGRLSRVAHPSPDHEARHFPKPRLSPLIGQDMKGKA
jgi:hypothetical protein